MNICMVLCVEKERKQMTNADMPYEFYAHGSSYYKDGIVLQFHRHFAGVPGPHTAPGFVGA